MKKWFLFTILLSSQIFFGATCAPTGNKTESEITKVVVLVHGYMRTKHSMRFLEKELSLDGYQVINETYPSVENSLEENADFLNNAIVSRTKMIKGKHEIYLVTYSMGGLVSRCYLNKYQPKSAIRMVMIAPPNRGSIRAEFFSDLPFSKTLLGPSGMELSKGEKYLRKLCGGTPDIPFGIIAGGKGDTEGYSHQIPGDDDGTVSVWSTYLPGSSDFILLKHQHTFMCYHKDVIDNTKNFLEYEDFLLHSTPPINK